MVILVALLSVFCLQALFSLKVAFSQSVGAYHPEGYNLLGSTANVSGALTDLQSDNEVYMTFRSYVSQTSAQALYAHQETINISGTSYYLQKLESADASGTILSASIASIGRQPWGKFVYPLTGVTSIPASLWTLYYRAWHSSVPETVVTKSPSSWPDGSWASRDRAQSSDNNYAETSTANAEQPYGNYGFIIPPLANIVKVEVGYEAYTDQDEKIGISVSWDGSSFPVEYVLPLGMSDPNLVTWVDFTDATSWTPNKLSDANFLTRAKAIKVGGGAMGKVRLDWIPVRVTYVILPIAHVDIDVLICQSDGTIRQVIATNVANSGTLSTTAQTLSGTYSWSAYTVVDQTDYLEIDYYVDVTLPISGVIAFLRIDDNTLNISDQTRATGIMLPSEYTMEVEFTGSSDTRYWSQLVWTIDSAWTTGSVSATLQLYNYAVGSYPTSGDGYIAYTSNATSNVDETKSQTITANPTNFRDSSGNWKIRIKGVKPTASQFDFKADLIELKVTWDTTPPVWSNAGTNSTIAGEPTLFYVQWTDSVELSGFIFGTNNTGTWKNETWTPMNGINNWSNVTKTLNGTVGIVVLWTVWANDTSNNWNATAILSLKTHLAPVASFTKSPSNPLANETITFDASASQDSDGIIATYRWDFGDGNVTEVPSALVSHVFTTGGDFTVLLTVIDNDGFSHTTLEVVKVGIPPVAVFSHSPDEPIANGAVVFNATESYDTDGTIVSYAWNFGDSNVTTVFEPTILHVYGTAGNYTVTLMVFDDDAHNGSFSKILNVVIHNVAILSVSPSATEVQAGQQVNVTVVVRNKGTTTETFNVTVYYNNTKLGTQYIVNLTAGAETTLTFTWDTAGLTEGATYTIRAETSQISGETDTTDNNLTEGVVKISLPSSTPSTPAGFWDAVLPYAIPIGAAIASILLLAVVTVLRKPSKEAASSVKAAPTEFQPFVDLTGGELPDAYSVMIVGDTSAGKSVLCQQLTHKYLSQGKPCIYVTYDCFPDEIRRNMKEFGWDVSMHEQNGIFAFVDCYSSIAGKSSQEKCYVKQPFALSELGITMSVAMDGLKQKSPRVFLDSSVPLFTRLEPAKVVEFLQDRSAQVKGENGVFFFTVGRGIIQEDLQRRLEEIVDCIVDMEVQEQKGEMTRKLRIRKLRGRPISDQWVSFQIDMERGFVLSVPKHSSKSQK